MPTNYLIYSAVSRNVPVPIVLSADLEPPDAPTGGTLQTAFCDTSAIHVWNLESIPFHSGLYVLQHAYSGFYANFGAVGEQVTLSPFVPFDYNSFVTINSGDPFQTRIQNANSGLCLKVAGSSYTPPAPVVADPGTDPAEGLNWLLVPTDVALE